MITVYDSNYYGGGDSFGAENRKMQEIEYDNLATFHPALIVRNSPFYLHTVLISALCPMEVRNI